jgi:hypothetical protein
LFLWYLFLWYLFLWSLILNFSSFSQRLRKVFKYRLFEKYYVVSLFLRIRGVMMKIFEGKLRRDRSASMQLSINAIVILVMAMAVLGLGLGIIRGLRAKADSFLDFEVNLDEEASATQRLTNVKDWSLKANTATQLGVGFYNTNNNCETNGAKVAFDCSDLVLNDASDASLADAFIIRQNPTRINVGESGLLKFQVTPHKDLVKDSYACSFQVFCVDEETKPVQEYPVFIQVTA